MASETKSPEQARAPEQDINTVNVVDNRDKAFWVRKGGVLVASDEFERMQWCMQQVHALQKHVLELQAAITDKDRVIKRKDREIDDLNEHVFWAEARSGRWCALCKGAVDQREEEEPAVASTGEKKTARKPRKKTQNKKTRKRRKRTGA